jgi:hypothetical protein
MHTQYSARPFIAHQEQPQASRANQGQLQNTQQNSNNSFQNHGDNQLNNEVFLQLLALIVALIQALQGAQQNTANEDTTNASSQTSLDGADGANGSAPLADILPSDTTTDSDNSNDSHAISSKQLFNTPVGADEAGPALPDQAYETTFTAKPGENLSFATMLVQSNDLFFAPDEAGIPLFDTQGRPLEGDVTDQVEIWDAGTELNEIVGEGANQAPRQSGANTGATDTDNRVRAVDPADLGISSVNEQIKAEIKYLGNDEFKLTLSNVSASSTLASPIAPGVAVVHSEAAPLFTNLQEDREQGLEALAEDGNAAILFGNL